MKKLFVACLIVLASSQLGSSCDPGSAPSVSVTLDAIPSTMNQLLIVPRSGFAVNVGFMAGADAIDPSTVEMTLQPWADGPAIGLGGILTADVNGARGVVPPALALAPGTYTVYVIVKDVAGRLGEAFLSFAVRDFPGGTPPIGTGQQIWLDFDSDRDTVPGPDFPVDLESFGLSAPAAPAVSATARTLVVEAVLERVDLAYADDPSGISAAPVAVTFTDRRPPSGDVTRICVGGEAPSGGVIGSIQIDPNNADRNSVECGTIPPTGVFPRGLLYFQSQSSFAQVFGPLRPASGGTPIGASPWDTVVLDPAFDPSSAPADAVARYEVVMLGIRVFADALGSIVAHEAGHALGLVPPGAPGVGLFGGSSGAAYTHSLNPDGSTPSRNLLMKSGDTFTFSKLAGLESNNLPAFRQIEMAYLRDRVVLAPEVTALLPPPRVSSVQPSVLSSSSVVTLTGTDLVATPSVRLLNGAYTYNALGETWVSSQQATFWVIRSQLPAGLYDVEFTNPDGQRTVLAQAITIQ